MIRWWNGVSAELDFTRAEGVKWFKGELNRLRNELELMVSNLTLGSLGIIPT